MMHYEQQRQYIPMRQREMQQEAEHTLLVEQARAGKKRVIARFYHGALAQVGRWMVMSGNHLQRRYGQVAVIAAACAERECEAPPQAKAVWLPKSQAH